MLDSKLAQRGYMWLNGAAIVLENNLTAQYS